MDFLNFTKNLQPLRIFSLSDIRLIEPDFADLNLTLWAQKGYLTKIRNGWYMFTDTKMQDLDYYLIANRIYSPSYISLELALNHYSVIPEAVLQITSITTNKTNTFETPFGTYVYRSLKPNLNFGYKIIEHQNQQIKIAELEKAILDYLYLRNDIANFDDFDGLRLNKQILKESISIDKLIQYLKIFENSALDERIDNLIKYIHNA